MKIIVKIKIQQKRNSIEVWVQRKKELDQDLAQIFEFFSSQLIYKSIRKIRPYYKITSDKPAIMLSLISCLQELIPEIFFNDTTTTVELKDELNL